MVAPGRARPRLAGGGAHAHGGDRLLTMPESRQSSSRRRLVVNADDFGRSQAINAGAIDAHVHGIVTSASLMVRHPAAPEAVAAARGHPELGLGLHLDLTEWELVEGTWRAKYDVVDTADPDAVRQEIE